jgi:class 3 adenylate cyclase
MNIMKYIQLYVMAVAMAIVTPVFSQTEDTAFVNNLLQQSKPFLGSDSAKAMLLSLQARDISKRLSYAKGEATALKNIGLVYYLRQHYLEALDNWDESLKIFEQIKDPNGIANLANNIAAIYKDRGVNDEALKYGLRSLEIAEQTGDKLRITSALTTIGATYYNMKDPRGAEYFLRALKTSPPEGFGVLYGNLGEVNFDLGEAAEKNKKNEAGNYYLKALSYYQQSIQADTEAVSTAFAYNGIGKVYFKQGKITDAIQSHQKALLLAGDLGDKWNAFKAYHGMANAYLKQNNVAGALDNYDKAEALTAAMQNATDIADLYKDMASAYDGTGDHENGYSYALKYADKQKEVYDAEVEKKMGQTVLIRNLSKKENEVALLTKQKQIEQQTKLGLAIGFGLILVIAIILFRNYKAKARNNRVLDKQNAEIEGLLLNILPAEVAKELQSTGKATPRHHDDVAVLFTDFKGFTSIADRMQPADVVTQLNACFMAFDEIIEKYGLEKIKTIGDAYMCAAGIPSKGERNTYRIVKAAIEIQEWVRQNNEKRLDAGMEAWDIRIGVHTGPLVAGVVGKKKYAYDIWGSTVNIASRMESNGEPGRVNISADAYRIIKDEFRCSYRGKIHAKNIGDIDMYFVDNEIPPYRMVGSENESLFLSETSIN